MLEISNLKARTGDTDILHGLSLSVNKGEVHAIMGPNGSGKSTLAQVIAGNDAYEVTDGSVVFNGNNLLDLKPEANPQDATIIRLTKGSWLRKKK